MVRVETRKDLRDLAKVAIEELAQTAVVVNRTRPGASRDEELEVRDAEGVLNVDGEDAEAKRVVGSAAEAVLVRPRGGLASPVLVRNPPDLADAVSVEVRRKRKLTHAGSGVSQSRRLANRFGMPRRPGSSPLGDAKAPYRNVTRENHARG
jgi:hypothetical protein